MTIEDDRAVAAGQRRATLLDLAVDRPVAVTMVVLAVAVFGFVSLQRLSVTLLPRISYPTLTVRTEYPGSAPSEVEELVTKPLEDNLAVISKLNSIRSVSRAGVSDLILEFQWNTDMSFAAQDVREKVDQTRPMLPQDVQKPLLLKYDPTLDPIMRLGLYGSTDLTRLRFYAEERLKKQLESIGGVAAVKVRGGYESEIRIDIDERALREMGVTVDRIRTRLQEENVNLASGILRDGDTEYLVRTLNEFRSVDEIRQLIIETRDSRLIRLNDIARVRRTDKEPDVVTRINGLPSVEIAVYKEDAANIVAVAEAVKSAFFGPDWRQTLVAGVYDASRALVPVEAKLDLEDGKDQREALRLVKLLPPGIEARLLSDQSVFIERSVNEVRDTGLYGAIFAVIVLFLFLRSGLSTLIIAISIPISIIATFGPMLQFDVTLNVMSLGGLALGIGMLVDASIVVLESIDRCRRDGDPIRTAALRGTREVAGAVVASVLTTVAVFFPIVFVEGIAGEIFKDQALTVVFSLLASLAVALFFIPMLAARPMLATLTGYAARPAFAARWRGLGAIARGSAVWGSIDGMRSWNRRRREANGFGRIARDITTPAAWVLFVAHLVIEAAGRLLFVVMAAAIALVLTPLAVVLWICGVLLRPITKAFDLIWRSTERAYVGGLSVALRCRLFIIVGACGLCWLAWAELANIGLDLIPALHSGEIIVELPQPVGTSLSTTSAATRRAEEAIDAAAATGALGLVSHSTIVGIARDEIAPPGEGPHTAKIHLNLPPDIDMAGAEGRAVDQARTALSRVAELHEVTFSAPRLFTFANPLEIQIRGERIAQIEALGRKLEQALAQRGFLDDLKTTVQDGSPEFVIRYDRVRLAERGLTLAGAAGVLRDKVKGTVPTRYSVSDESRKIDVLVRIPEEAITGLDELAAIDVGGNPTRPVALAEVATIAQGRGPSEVRHVGGERAVLLTATPADVDLAQATALIGNTLDAMRAGDPELFRGVVVKVAGQSEEAERSSRALLFALGLALVLVYIVMASQFESLVDPFIIMFSSVFAGVGAVFALSWAGLSASIVVFIGAIMLAGIVVNNAIVLIDCINRLRRAGMSHHAAIIEAGSQRLRPILMTTATTVLGLLPMAASTGEGAEMRVPMAVTVIAGLTSSTVLTLIIIPVLHSLAHGALRVGDVGRDPRPEGVGP